MFCSFTDRKRKFLLVFSLPEALILSQPLFLPRPFLFSTHLSRPLPNADSYSSHGHSCHSGRSSRPSNWYRERKRKLYVQKEKILFREKLAKLGPGKLSNDTGSKGKQQETADDYTMLQQITPLILFAFMRNLFTENVHMLYTPNYETLRGVVSVEFDFVIKPLRF